MASGSEVMIEVDGEEDQHGNKEEIVGVCCSVPLEDGKNYHLFLSHSTEDIHFVNTLVQELENNYGLKCVYSYRDFTAGQLVLDQISQYMVKSMMIVMILSPDFLKSQFCLYEVDIACRLNFDRKYRCIIPVMFRKCPVPDTLKHINYIDVEQGEDVEQRIVKAIEQREIGFQRDILPDMVMGIQLSNEGDLSEMLNGARITVQSQSTSSKWCSLRKRWYFPCYKDLLKSEMEKINIKMDDDDVDSLVMEVNDLPVLRNFGLYVNCKQVCCCSFFLPLIIYTLAMIITFLILIYQAERGLLWDPGFVAMLAVLTPVSFLGFACPLNFALRFGAMRFLRKLSKSRVMKLNERWHRRYSLIVIVEYRDEPVLTLMRYDSTPCKTNIQQLLMAIQKAEYLTEEELQRETDAYTEQLIQKCILEFYEKFFSSDWSTFPDAGGVVVHPVLGEKKCLCQLIRQLKMRLVPHISVDM